jgi:hypothetical protein
VKLLWHNYLVAILGNYAMKMCTETGLRAVLMVHLWYFLCTLNMLVHKYFLMWQVINWRERIENGESIS